MRIGIVSLGGESSKQIAEACKDFFNKVDELQLKEFEVQATKSEIKVSHLKKDLEKYDCIYIRGSYKYALLQRAITRALQQETYMPIKPKAFAIGHDKFLTILELQKNNVAIPKTYYASTTKLATKILENEVDYPVIIKVPDGTHGKGVMIADSLKSAKTILDILEQFKRPFIIQEFVETEKTSDIRAVVAGKKVIAAYKRIACNGEIRTNIHLGGKREEHKLTPEEEKLALDSAEAVGADICGVDILNNSHPSVIEVNLSPGIYNLKEVVEENVPRKIAEVLYEKTLKFKKRKNKLSRKKQKKNGKKKIIS